MALIKITGVGVDTSVDVPEGATVEVLLAEAGIDAGEVNVEVNGESVSPSDTASPGDTVTATPKAASLG